METIDNKEKFIEIVNTNIHRDGINDLMKYLEKCDFYTAPASSRFHGAVKGGLLSHSLNVYHRLMDLFVNEYGSVNDKQLESLTIISLFHDLCKVNYYKEDFRNVKNDKGQWERVPCYTVDELTVFGYHGCKSAFLIERFMKLSVEEYISVACHMGAYDRPNGDYSIGNVFEKYNLAFLLHTADCMATFIDEKE